MERYDEKVLVGYRWFGSMVVTTPASATDLVAPPYTKAPPRGRATCRFLLVSLRRGNRPHQRGRVDLIRHSSLREVDQCEQEELGIVKNAENWHFRGPESEEQYLNDRGRPHKKDLSGVVYAGFGHLYLLGHRHDGGGEQEDFDPRESVPPDIEQRYSRIGEDKPPDDVQEQYINESRHVAEDASSWASAMGSVGVASDCGANMVCICCHPRILVQSLR